jgi:hypothetical protein
MEKSGSAGEEYEGWRAEMCDPTCEENAGCWTTGGDAGVHTDVVQCHQHHHNAAHNIERDNASSGERNGALR